MEAGNYMEAIDDFEQAVVIFDNHSHL